MSKNYHLITRGIVPIRTKFMDRNQLFALEFQEGFFFGRVIRRRICQWKPWPLIDANGNDVDLAPSGSQAEVRFNDPRNVANDILYLSATTDVGLPWFFHGAFGIDPQQINMYLRYPEGDIIPGKFPQINPIRPTSGDNISALKSQVSPYEEPTDYHEIVIQPQIHIGAEYYNRDPARHHQPIINLLFALYWCQILKKNTHPTLIADIALKRYEGADAVFLQCGFGDKSNTAGPQLIQDWRETPMSLDEAAMLGGIRRGGT